MTYGNWPMTNDICHWSLASSHMSFKKALLFLLQQRRNVSLRHLSHRDASDFLMRRKINNGKPVEVGKLCEDAFRRAVRIAFKRHRTDAQIKVQHPRDVLGLSVDDGNTLSRNGTGDCVFAIRCHVRVMDGPPHGNTLYPLKRNSIDDIDGTRRLRYRHIDPSPVTAGRDVVGMSA